MTNQVMAWECSEPEGVILLDSPMSLVGEQLEEKIALTAEAPKEVKDRKFQSFVVRYADHGEFVFGGSLTSEEGEEKYKAEFVAHRDRLDGLTISAIYHDPEFKYGCSVEIRRAANGYNKSLNTDASDAGAG